MEKKEVPLTYETLFELVMREKSREELQKLDAQFYANVRSYLDQKQQILFSQETDAFVLQQKERTLHQLKNIRRLIRELYERRERKVLNMALVRSRTGSAAMDMSSMLAEERALFDALVGKLDESRSGVLHQMLVDRPVRKPVVVPEDKTRIRILNDVPRFVGRDLTTYGPFEAGATPELPSLLARILIDKGSAEKV